MAEEEQIKEEYLNPVVQIPVKLLNLGKTFKKQNNEQLLTIQDILTKYKMLAIFFGRSSCAISNTFLGPMLNFYEEINLEEKQLQVIFVGIEKSEQHFKNFIKDMPWLYIPFNDPRINDLKQYYNVRTIPQVILLKSDGTPLDINARDQIYEANEETFNRWIQAKYSVDK